MGNSKWLYIVMYTAAPAAAASAGAVVSFSYINGWPDVAIPPS